MTRKFRLYGAVLLLLALAASLRADVFQGTVTGVIDGVKMYHDYGHNPAEMRGALSVGKMQHPHRR